MCSRSHTRWKSQTNVYKFTSIRVAHKILFVLKLFFFSLFRSFVHSFEFCLHTFSIQLIESEQWMRKALLVETCNLIFVENTPNSNPLLKSKLNFLRQNFVIKYCCWVFSSCPIENKHINHYIITGSAVSFYNSHPHSTVSHSFRKKNLLKTCSLHQSKFTI